MVGGGAKLGWFMRLVKVASKRRWNCSLRRNEAGGDRGCARSNENTDATSADGPRRDGIDRVDAEHAAGGGIGDVRIADAIGTLQGAAIRDVEIARIVAGAGGGGQIGPSLPEGNGAEGPPAESKIGGAIHA